MAVLVGALALRVVFARPASLVGEAPRDGYTRVGGVVHVHTTLSDGGGRPEDVVAAARQAGLAFVVITDHNVLDAKPMEGYRDGVLVIVGTEISTSDGHIVALGIPDPRFRFSGDARDALQDVRDMGGFAFAAHPNSPRPDFRFSGSSEPGPWGLELLNGDSQWRAAGLFRLARTLLLYPLNPRHALLGSLTAPTDTLAQWDRMLASRQAAGLAGADAHNRIPLAKKFAPRFPSYRSVFELMRTWAVLDAPLSGDAAADTAAIVQALGRGRSYVGMEALAPAADLSFIGRSGESRWTMGDVVPAESRPRLEISGRMPEGARVRILKDGREVAAGEGGASVDAAGEGVYRAEVHLEGSDVPWVITNAIDVSGPARSGARQARAAWPSPEAPPDAVEVLDAFEGKSTFEPASDTSSRLDRPVIAAGEGVKGSSGARLRFHVAEPTPAHPDVFVALVSGQERNLTGKAGLVLSIRADGAYRLWLQVRDANPASRDEGTEWWFASLKAGPEWQRVAVPFARLRSINPATDGRLDLDKVRAVVFVIDKGSVVPGTRGTVWLDDIGLY